VVEYRAILLRLLTAASGPQRRFTAAQQHVCNREQTGRSVDEVRTAVFDQGSNKYYWYQWRKARPTNAIGFSENELFQVIDRLFNWHFSLLLAATSNESRSNAGPLAKSHHISAQNL
jgi:hypothetical protein